MKRFLISLGLLFVSSALMADNTNPGGLEPVPEPPVMPDPIDSGENIEQQVTIISKQDAVIEEYRVNGFLYMVKVTPVIGPPYYLIDNNGDGRLESRIRNQDEVVIPQWVLFTWK